MADIVAELNREFKDILFDFDSPPGPARDEMEKLNQGLLRERCAAGGKALPTSLKPCFMAASRIEYAAEAVLSLLDAIEKAVKLYFENPELKGLFEIGDEEKALLAIDPGYPGRSIVFARADTFMSGSTLKLLEFNCDSPGGAYFTDVQVGLLAGTEPIRLLQRRYPFTHDPLVPRVLDALLKKYGEWGGGRANPTIAVVGDGGVFNAAESALFGEYFNREGFNGFPAGFEDLEYDGHVLYGKGVPVNIVYRHGAASGPALQRGGGAALVRAMRDGNVCAVNPLRARLGDHKSLLSLLTDDRISAVLDEKQKEYVRLHVPWTRVLREGSTTYQGFVIDLLEFVSANREKFVIKPDGGFGGSGVVIGREAGTKEWYSAIEARNETKMVVQEYVPVPQEEFPVFSPELGFAVKKVNHNFLVFDGEFAGGFARISDSSVINVSAGGGIVPFMTVEDD